MIQTYSFKFHMQTLIFWKIKIEKKSERERKRKTEREEKKSNILICIKCNLG